MANSKKIAKRILRIVGKGFYYFGKGLWLLAKGIGKDIRILYRDYEERRRIEEMRRQHYLGIERENYYAGRGWARGAADVTESVRIRRQNERDNREHMRRLDRMFELPQVNDDFFTQDLEPRRRKKKRSMFGF